MLAVLLAAAVAGAWAVWHAGFVPRARDVLDLLEAHGIPPWLALSAVQLAIVVSGVLPASLVCLAAGAAYGIVNGALLAGAGTLAGAFAAFFLSRSALRPVIARRVARNARLAAFDAALQRGGWRTVFLLRLSPVLPFAPASYALGLSSIGWRDYAIGTLASLPALVLTVAAGHFARLGFSGRALAPYRAVWLAIGVIATLAASWRIGRMAAQALRDSP